MTGRLCGMMTNAKKLKYIVYDSETVVYDQSGNRIVSCPTEDEAVEFIRDFEKKPQRVLKVNGILVEVSEEVYIEYYRLERRERYQVERDISKGKLYYDGFNMEDSTGSEFITSSSQKSVEELVELKYMTEQLLNVFTMLDNKEQLLLQNIYYQNKSVRQISREWNIPESTLRRKHEELLLKMRKMLE